MKDEEKNEKMERMHAKMHAALVDVAMEMYEKEDVTNLRKLIDHKLRAAKAGTSISYVRAFAIGIEFGIASQEQDQGVPVLAGVRLILAEDEKAMSKKIDGVAKT